MVYSFGILMYEILTDSIPYPDLLSHDLKDYEFKTLVINKSYLPEFKFPIKKSLRQLIEKCWSNDPNERPSFDEIFDKLSNRIKSEEEENYLLDDVDMEKFNIYITNITSTTYQIDQLLQKIKFLEKTNQILKTENNQQFYQIKTLENANQRLKTENTQQFYQIKTLEKVNQKLKIENIQQLDQIETLKTISHNLKIEFNHKHDRIIFLEKMNQKLKNENNFQFQRIGEIEQSDTSDFQSLTQIIDEYPNQLSENVRNQRGGDHQRRNRGRGGRQRQNESTKIEEEESDDDDFEIMQNDKRYPLHPNKHFDEIITGPMSGPILQAINDLNFIQPTKIQNQAIPILNDGQNKDLIAQSQIGSGKTLAFIVSMLLHVDPKKQCLQTICLCHTRELTMQNFNVFKIMNKYTKLTGDYCVNNNDANATPSNKEAQLLFGTPTSFTFWIKEGELDISQVNFLVIDEADAILDRSSTLYPLTYHLLKILPQNVQYAFFSSTLTNSIIFHLHKRRRNIITIRPKRSQQCVQTVTHLFTRVENQDEGFKSILDLVTIVTKGQTMIFARSNELVKEISEYLLENKVSCKAFSSDLSPQELDKTLDEFRNEEFRVLITSDVLARGIHFSNVYLVINYQTPIQNVPIRNHGQNPFIYQKQTISLPDCDTYYFRAGKAGGFDRRGICFTVVIDEKDEQILKKFCSSSNLNIQLDQIDKNKLAELPVD